MLMSQFNVDALNEYTYINFLRLFVHMIIIDQVTVIDSRAILVAVTSECCVKRAICKIWTGHSAWHWHTVQTHMTYRRTQRLIRVYIVCLNDRK